MLPGADYPSVGVEFPLLDRDKSSHELCTRGGIGGNEENRRFQCHHFQEFLD